MRLVDRLLTWWLTPALLPPPPPPAACHDLAAVLDTLFAAHNRERAVRGVAPLVLDAALCRLAQRHSDDQAAHQSLGHAGSDGRSPFDRLRRVGYVYTTAGENVAMGYPTATTVVAGWMNSADHRANILRRTFTHVGFGEAADRRGRMYWTALFAAPAPAGVRPAGAATPALVPPPLEGLTSEVLAAIDERLASGDLRAV